MQIGAVDVGSRLLVVVAEEVVIVVGAEREALLRVGMVAMFAVEGCGGVSW